jgi:hypothetical protein
MSRHVFLLPEPNRGSGPLFLPTLLTHEQECGNRYTEREFLSSFRTEGSAVAQSWLILAYRVPSDPSRHRVQIWRKVKTAGAIFLQSAVCVLPAGRNQEQSFRKLRKEIEEARGGQAYLFRCEYLGPPGVLEELFNQGRDEEYVEIIHRCEEFLKEIEEETGTEHFTFAELEENEEDLAKLEKWFGKVKKRDFFAAPKGTDAARILDACRTSLAVFSDRVFSADDRRMQGEAPEKRARKYPRKRKKGVALSGGFPRGQPGLGKSCREEAKGSRDPGPVRRAFRRRTS